MNTAQPGVRRSGRQSSRTKFFVPHYDVSYVTPKANKQFEKREMANTQGGSNELPNSSTSSLDGETKKRKQSNKNLVHSLSVNKKHKIDESKLDGDELSENENPGSLANIRNPEQNSSEGSSKTSNVVPKKKSPSRKCNDAPTKPKKRKTKIQKIKDQLRALGDKPDDCDGDGNCARAAIYNGFIKLTGQPSDLDQVIISGKLDCGHECKATLSDLLRQPDYAGTDYLDVEYATVYCDGYEDEDCYPGATYVTGICSGNPTFDSGKFHNHCNRCKTFGKCIGDYREGHCNRCGKHFFAGSGGQFKCECRERGRGRGGDDCVLM